MQPPTTEYQGVWHLRTAKSDWGRKRTISATPTPLQLHGDSGFLGSEGYAQWQQGILAASGISWAQMWVLALALASGTYHTSSLLSVPPKHSSALKCTAFNVPHRAERVQSKTTLIEMLNLLSALEILMFPSPWGSNLFFWNRGPALILICGHANVCQDVGSFILLIYLQNNDQNRIRNWMFIQNNLTQKDRHLPQEVEI